MRFSALQKFILFQCYTNRHAKHNRDSFLDFYNKKRKHSKQKDIVNTITKSLERLIDREFIVGYGVRTPHKWYICEVKLTSKGRRQAKKLLGEQQKLPLE